jgi:Glyoxalase-like domain
MNGLDHLVFGATDLATAVDDLAARTGVRAVPGGRHTGLGTHNALLALGPDTYLEIIAPDLDQQPPAMARPFGLDTLTTSRLITWALKAPDIDAHVAAARAAAYDPGVVISMSRRRPDGVDLAWRLTRTPRLPGDGLVPFLIDWGATPHPATTAAAGCTLVDLRAEHPEPGVIRPLLKAVDAELLVERGPAPALIATLETPLGRVQLR